jgi:preprotein translocase subunit SecE
MAVTKQDQEAVASTTFGLMKYVHAMFFAGTVVVGWIFVKLAEDIWATMHFKFGWVPAPRDWMAIGGGAVLAMALGLYMWRHPKVNRLAVEIVTELSKVTWPTRKELSVSTVVVIVVSIIAAVILGLFDLFWSWVTDFIY